jgi:hypothetical protein
MEANAALRISVPSDSFSRFEHKPILWQGLQRF